MYYANNREHTVPFFKNTANLPVNMLYYESVSKLMYVVNNKLAPKNITDLFTQIDTVHSHGTRASIAGNYLVKYSRTTLQKMLFLELVQKYGTYFQNIFVIVRKKNSPRSCIHYS